MEDNNYKNDHFMLWQKVENYIFHNYIYIQRSTSSIDINKLKKELIDEEKLKKYNISELQFNMVYGNCFACIKSSKNCQKSNKWSNFLDWNIFCKKEFCPAKFEPLCLEKGSLWRNLILALEKNNNIKTMLIINKIKNIKWVNEEDRLQSVVNFYFK